MPIYVGNKQVSLPGISKVFVGDKMVYNPDGKYTVRCNIAEAADYYEIDSGTKRYVMWYVNEKPAPGDASGACILSTPSGSTNGGTYYETDETWRIYDNTSGSYGLDIACSSGYIITKIGIEVGRSSCYIRDPRGHVIHPTNSSGMLYFPVYNHFGNSVHLRISGNTSFTSAGNAYINNIYVEYEHGYAQTNRLDYIELLNPGPTQFIQAEQFYYSGTVRAWYTRNFYQDVTNSCTFTGFNTYQLGEQNVIVSYTEGGVTQTADYDITVIANELDYIEVLNATTIFQNGSTFVFDGDVYAHYLDGGYSQVYGYTVNSSSVNMNVDGTYPVYVSYTEGGITKTTSYIITVSSASSSTISTVISDYATANDWTNSQKYTQVIMNPNITVNVVRQGNSSGTYYSSGGQWRIYESDSGGIQIVSSAGKLLGIKITYSNSNSGVLEEVNTSTVFSTGTYYNVSSWNTNSITLMANNGALTTYGQVRITQIVVEYSLV